MRYSFIISAFFLCFIFFVSTLCFGDGGFLYKEANLIGGYSDREGWIGKSDTLKNSLGLEYYRKFSGERGDYLTADLQLRATYDSREDSDDAWGFEIHNAWLKYKLGLGKDIIFGHFDPSFGLEPVLDTHGTILQTLLMKNLGFKKDWGIGFRGALADYDYETSFQLGSGMNMHRKDNNGLFSARLSQPSSGNPKFGISLLYGRVLATENMNTLPRPKITSDGAILKRRIGLDGQYLFGPYNYKAEFAYGKDDNKDVLGYFFEIDYTLPKMQNLEVELQFQSWINDLEKHGSDDSILSLGASYKINNKLTLRLTYIQDLNLYMGNEDKKVLLQFYYYGT